MYKRYKYGEPPISAWKTAIRSLLENSGPSYIIIDALDECPNSGGERAKLTSALKDLKEFGIASLHILVTSRKEADVEKALSPIVTMPPLSIQNTEVDGDIRTYVVNQLGTDPKLSKWPNSIKEEMKRELVERACGMYVTFKPMIFLLWQVTKSIKGFAGSHAS